MTSKSKGSNPLKVAQIYRETGKLPKTPLEEILFCVESTNDIVSKILTLVQEIWTKVHEDDSL